MREHKEPIPSMIYNASVGGHVTNSQQIIDENENKEQSQINAEVKETLGEGGSVDNRISQAKTEIIGGASTNGNTLKKVEDRVSPLESAVGTGGSVDSRISAAVATEASRAQTAEEQLRQVYEALSQSQPIPVTELPATGETGKIYRLAGTTSYADYMYAEGALTTPIKMAEYDNAIDDEPTVGSANLIKSGGVFNLQVKNGDEFISLMSDIIVDKYINSGGNAITDEDYYITPKIQVSQGDKIKWYLGETSSSYPCLVFFDSNNQKIDWMSPSSAQPYTVPANTSYLRASMRKDAKGLSFVIVNNILKFSYPLVWDSLDALNKKDEETDKEINSSKTDLFFYDINKNILINKSYPATSFWNNTQNDEGWGAVPPIEVNGGETINVSCGNATNNDIYRYLLAFDENYERINYWKVNEYDERTITLPNDTKYLCMSVYLDNIENAYIKIGNTYLYKGSSLIKQNDGVFPLQNLLKFRVAAWNIGLMHEGVPPTGIEPEDYDTQLASLKEVITNLSADILILEEYSSKVDSEDTQDSYDTVFKQFYPFYKAVNQSIAIFSRYPLFIDDIETTSNGSPYMKGYINVNNIKVGIIACHISGSATPEQRAADSNTFISLMNTYKYSIIAGDFNTGNLDTETEQDIQQQLSPYINNEYSLGNWGYWGRKTTYRNGKALDNITAKIINILCYNVLNERSVSDHYPTFSDVSLLPY